MQFQVPQFLDVEDKIIGPFTIKQFIYLAGGVGMGYMLYRFIPLVGPIVGLAAIAIGWALGFYKYNGKPFVHLIQSAFLYAQNGRLYIWKRAKRPDEGILDLSNFKTTKRTGVLTGQHHTSKLSGMAWSIGLDKSTEEEDALT